MLNNEQKQKLSVGDQQNYPNNLTAAQYHELTVGSAIHPSVIERNFFHIQGETVYSYLFISPEIPRKNTGRVTDGFLKRYLHLTDGGMWISGLDPQQNWKPMEWGRFKPTKPRINLKTGKIVKYESPPKTPNRVTYFDVSEHVWNLIAKRYNIKRYHSSLALRLQDRLNPLIFWEWVKQHPEIPIILCEGEKKAACLLSLGFVAIPLPGIWNGRVGQKDFDERLHPDLIPFAQTGRKFQILFDHESKITTRWSVYQATVRTGTAIEAVGCACEVVILPGPEKGVDDFVVARGEDANALLTAMADDALSLKDYRQSFLIKHRGLRKYKPDIIVNVKYLSQAILVKEPRNQESNVESETYQESEGDKRLLTNYYSPSSPSSDPSPDSRPVPERFTQHKPKQFILPTAGLIVLISEMGTGKTELMRQWREANPNQRFLNNGHRVNLLKNLAQRLKTDMYSDLSYKGMAQSTALSITIDSLYKLNTQALTYGCVFIDEACQYLTHLLLSNTCKEHRAAILEVLHYIVYNAPMVVIADAHMDDVTIDFFRRMRPEGEKPMIFKNEWQNGERTIYWHEGKDSSALVAQISLALMTEQKIMVVSDSKRFIKKLEQLLTVKIFDGGEQPDIEKEPGLNKRQGSRDLLAGEKEQKGIRPQLLRQLPAGYENHLTEVGDSDPCSAPLHGRSQGSFPPAKSPLPPASSLNSQLNSQLESKPHTLDPTQTGLKIWSIHSENSGSEENVAFIKDITNAVKNLDALLASPSLGTGVDIPEYHFDLVFGVFHGSSQTATECAQQLWRYRPKVPIHIWVSPKPPFGYQNTNPTKIKERLLQTNEITAFLLRIDRETGKRGAEKDWALDAYCQIKASRNQSLNNLRADLRNLLTEMGNKILTMGDVHDPQTKKSLKKAADVLDAAHNQAVAKAQMISSSEYHARLAKDYLSPQEIYECEKFRIHDAYGMEVNETLVTKDKGGKLISHLAALEAMLGTPGEIATDLRTNQQFPTPPIFVADRDRAERKKFTYCMDWGNYSAQWLVRYSIGLHSILWRLVGGQEITATDPQLLKMRETVIKIAPHIKAVLGFTVSPNCEPIWLLGLLLDQLGLKLVFRQIGGRGKQVKFFSLSEEELIFALKVIEHRQTKRAQMVFTPPPDSRENSHYGGVDTTSQKGRPAPKLIKTSLEQLRNYLSLGAEAIKSLLSHWDEDLRWFVFGELKSVAPLELLFLEQLIPQIYDWL